MPQSLALRGETRAGTCTQQRSKTVSNIRGTPEQGCWEREAANGAGWCDRDGKSRNLGGVGNGERTAGGAPQSTAMCILATDSCPPPQCVRTSNLMEKTVKNTKAREPHQPRWHTATALPQSRDTPARRHPILEDMDQPPTPAQSARPKPTTNAAKTPHNRMPITSVRNPAQTEKTTGKAVQKTSNAGNSREQSICDTERIDRKHTKPTSTLRPQSVPSAGSRPDESCVARDQHPKATPSSPFLWPHTKAAQMPSTPRAHSAVDSLTPTVRACLHLPTSTAAHRTFSSASCPPSHIQYPALPFPPLPSATQPPSAATRSPAYRKKQQRRPQPASCRSSTHPLRFLTEPRPRQRAYNSKRGRQSLRMTFIASALLSSASSKVGI